MKRSLHDLYKNHNLSIEFYTIDRNDHFSFFNLKTRFKFWEWKNEKGKEEVYQIIKEFKEEFKVLSAKSLKRVLLKLKEYEVCPAEVPVDISMQATY